MFGAPPLISVQSLAAERGLRPLFAEVSLTLNAGELTLLRGPNGTGKTTLLRILAGLTEAAQGTMSRPESTLYWGHASAVKDELTASENLRLLCTHASVPVDAMREALARVGLAQRTHVLARKLSAGQRRRIGLAWLSLATQRVWLLDEPTTALDAQGVELFADILNAHLANQGAAIVATHLDIPSIRVQPTLINMDAYAR